MVVKDEIVKSTLKTTLQDERSPHPGNPRSRGARYWSGAEISARRWFVAEVYVLVPEADLITFVTPQLSEAKNFIARNQVAEWSRILVRMRAPGGYGMIFEELKEVYRSEQGDLILHLANGLVVMEAASESSSNAPLPPNKFRRLYSSTPA